MMPLYYQAIPDLSTDEDQMAVISLIGNDADGDSIYFSVTSSENINSVITVGGDGVMLTPVQDWFGLGEVSVTLHDGSGLTDSQTFSLIVNPVNDAPVIGLIDSLIVDEGSNISFFLYAELYQKWYSH